MIMIVDYDMGNVDSIRNMLEHIGASSVISSNPSELELAAKIILPGVDAVGNTYNLTFGRGR